MEQVPAAGGVVLGAMWGAGACGPSRPALALTPACPPRAGHSW